MNFPVSLQVSGCLLAPRRSASSVPDVTALFSKFHSRTLASSAPGWERLIVESPEPLLAEDRDRGPFQYFFVVRKSGDRALLASSVGEMVPLVLKRASVADKLITPSIDVPRIVEHLTTRPDLFSMSRIWARVDGYGQSLRTVILHGADLAEAKLFRNILPELTSYRVTLRDVRTHRDALTIGSKGEVSFITRGADSLRDVDRALRFLSTSGYLIWAD